MLKRFAYQLFTGIQSLKPVDEGVHRDIYGRVVERGEDFFHPKKFRGIPMFDVPSIMGHYQPQLDKIRTHVDIGSQRLTPDGRSLYDALYLDIIKRYVEFCHMIPASEDHHHSETGGLILHSLEASVESLRWAKEKKARVTGMVDIDAKIKPVFDYCAWLAGLLHDAGKLMRDISVDAVEVIHPYTKRPIPITEHIRSWHPARESLIEWAREHNVSSYSVNFLVNRVARRHNIDSSQILQPLLRGQFAMDYLLSTPIKQELYSELTRVLSGYSSSEDMLSESVRMGDSASTTRDLGYLYDETRGTRKASTAQRLFKCIRAASSEWDFNRLDGKGWIIGNDVYIRWSSSIDHIIKTSVSLGYSLPADVKNVLNIMDSNLLTDLFDRKSPNDRIIKFAPGKFDESQAKAIVSGKVEQQWLDLLKLRGPQIVFAEAPMPFSQPGLIYLPNAKRTFIITKEGETTEVKGLSPSDKDTQTVTQDTQSQAPSAPSNNPAKASKTTPSQSSTSSPAPKPADQNIPSPTKNVGVMPTRLKPSDRPKQLTFVNATPSSPAPSDITLSESTSDEQNQVQPQQETTTTTVKKRHLSPLLEKVLSSSISPHVQDEQVVFPLDALSSHLDMPGADIISALEKSGELFINLSAPAIKTVLIQHADSQTKGVKLTKRASSYFLENTTPSSDNAQKTPRGSSSFVAPETSPAPAKQKIQTKRLLTPDTCFTKDGQLYCDIRQVALHHGLSLKALMSLMTRRRLLDVDTPFDALPLSLEHDGQTLSCLRLKADLMDTVFAKAPKTSPKGPSRVEADAATALPEKLHKHPLDIVPSEGDALHPQLTFLSEASPDGSLLHFLKAHEQLGVISPVKGNQFQFNYSRLDPGLFKIINRTLLRNYMRAKDIRLTDGGYVLSPEQLQSISLSEVS